MILKFFIHSVCVPIIFYDIENAAVKPNTVQHL